MADYAPLITRAVDALPENTAEARHGIYERARNALTRQLRSIQPPLAEADIERETRALDEAIRRIETDASAKESIALALENLDLGLSDATAVPKTQMPQAHVVVKDAGPAAEAPLPSAEEAREALAKSVAEKPKSPPVDAHVFDDEAQKLPPAPKPVVPVSAPAPLNIPPIAGPSVTTSEPEAPSAPMVPPATGVDMAAIESGKETGLQPLRPVSRPQAAGFGLQKKKRGGVLAPLVAVLMLLGAIGGGYWMWLNRKVEAPVVPPPPVTQTPAQEKPKSSDRVNQVEPPAEPVAEAPPKPAEPAPVQQAPAVHVPSAERASLLEEAPISQQSETATGTVTWRTETLSAGTGQPPDLAIRADIDIPQRRMAVTLTIRRNTDPTLPASHTIEVMFKLPRDFPHGGIANVPGLLVKANEQGRGMPVIGQSVRVMNGFFFIGLSSAEGDRLGNVQMLKERQWIDIPIEYDNRRRAILSIDKGASGQKAFDEAFKAWGE